MRLIIKICSIAIAVSFVAITCVETALAAAPACQPTGPQKGLVIAVNFPSNPNQSKSINKVEDDYFATNKDSVKDYWDEVSYGQTALTGDTLGWFTLDYADWQSCDIFDIRDQALAAAAAFVDVSEYNRFFLQIVKPPECPAQASGQATGCTEVALPGGGSVMASTSWNYVDNIGLLIHEGGHNLGLPHANSEDHGASQSIGAIGAFGTDEDYGDPFDVMGELDHLGHHNALYKHRLGLLTDADVIDVVTSGTHVIEPLTIAGNGKRALRIFRGANWLGAGNLLPIRKEYLWVETRKDSGYDANLRQFASLAHTVYGGALVHIDHNYTTNSHILDMHPGGGFFAFEDASLVEGETFTDPFTGITIDHDALFSPSGDIRLIVTIPDPDSDQDGIPDATEAGFGMNTSLEDSDGDTLTDFYEVCYDNDCSQYNPGVTDLDASMADTDGDGMPDDYEVGNSLNPLVNDSALDSDADGLTNLQEYLLGTDPQKADTDADRLSDWDEVSLYETDPLDGADSDADGMADDWENVRGTNAALNDARSDPDNDGVDNAIEYLRDTLPLDNGSTPNIQTIYVDASNFFGNGSQADPFGDIDWAVSAAQDGDTLIIASGNYAVSSLNIQKSINLFGPADRSATITGYLFVYANAIWGNFSGITLELGSAGHFIQALRNVNFSNCHVQLTGQLYFSATDVLWRNCTLAGPADGSVNGLRFESDGYAEFVNTTITGFTSALSILEGDPGLKMRNSILDNTDDLAGVQNTTGFSYNLISDGDLAGVNGNLTGSPQFVDAMNSDYHLQQGSVGIDAGDPADDYSAEPVPNGLRINMGAYGNTGEAALGAILPLTLEVDYVPQAGYRGKYYFYDGLSVSGGQPPYIWSVIGGWLPWPLMLNPQTGVISGLPADVTTTYFTLQVSDANLGTATVNLQIEIKQSDYVCGSCHTVTGF